jgi:uncharacterized membrane protein YkvA (DUF1232 family)
MAMNSALDPGPAVRLRPILAILGALLYGASPIDLIPELVPLFGVLDDALVVPTLFLLGIVWLAQNKRRARKAIEVPARAD